MALISKEPVNYLELTPVKHKESILEENGKVSLIIPRFYNRLLKKLMKPLLKRDHYKIKLDDFGTAVWNLIDGEKSVQAIASELRTLHGEAVEPAEGRLTTFLTTLYRNEFITFSELTKKR